MNTRPVERGYANRTLYINLSDNTITSKPVTQQMKDIFTGGKGFCMWLLWNAVKPSDPVGRSRKRNRDRGRADWRHHGVSRLRQIDGGDGVAADRIGD